jgi:hypothetical protein
MISAYESARSCVVSQCNTHHIYDNIVYKHQTNEHSMHYLAVLNEGLHKNKKKNYPLAFSRPT